MQEVYVCMYVCGKWHGWSERGSGLRGVWLGKLGAGSSGDFYCCVVVFSYDRSGQKWKGGLVVRKVLFVGDGHVSQDEGEITGMQISILFLCICECYLVFFSRKQSSFFSLYVEITHVMRGG